MVKKDLTGYDVLTAFEFVCLEAILLEQVASDHALHYVRVRCLGLIQKNTR